MQDQFNSLSFSQRWVLAIRPKTLTAAVAPVVVGWGVAATTGKFHWGAAIAALITSIMIQIGTNLVNDVVDFSKGADTEDRTGPLRVTQSGLLTPRQVWLGVFVTFGVAVVAGLYLTWVAGWLVLVIGAASLISGIAYTAGPFPLAYHGFGDIFVLLFFGVFIFRLIRKLLEKTYLSSSAVKQLNGSLPSCWLQPMPSHSSWCANRSPRHGCCSPYSRSRRGSKFGEYYALDNLDRRSTQSSDKRPNIY